MRNVFDQYTQPENRLTHALVSALAHDTTLLVALLKWLGVTPTSSHSTLSIVEQQVPGQKLATDESEAERRGLPDASIFNDQGWSLIIESKVQSRVSLDQLRRHVRTATRHGFEDPLLLVLAVGPPPKNLPESTIYREWREVYAWARTMCAKSFWARQLTEYFRVFESRMLAVDYNIRGTITMFDGLRFDEESPYTYHEAKHQLRLLADELQTRKDLADIGADPKGPRRPAITGRDASRVWDFIPLIQARNANSFTAFPHLTLGLGEEDASATITIPNGVKGGFKRKLREAGDQGFSNLLSQLEADTRPVRRRSKGSTITASILQRHYKSQRSIPTVDAQLNFDIRAVVQLRDCPVKYQPEWFQAMYAILTQKRSNIQFQIGVHFSYDCPAVRSRKAIDLFANAWIGLSPILRFVLED